MDYLDYNWQIFLQAQKQANIFHHAAWSQLMQECYGYQSFIVVLQDNRGEICAGMPMMEVKRAFTYRRWVSIPFTDHCSPLFYDVADLEELKRALVLEVQKPRTPRMEVRWDLFDMDMPSEFVLHTLRLESDVDKVSQGIHHSHLRNIRLARSKGIEIRHGVGKEDLTTFYDLHLQTRHRQGVPIQPWKYFKLLDELLLQRGLGFISLAWYDGTCLAGAVFLHWQDTLTYKYGASTELGLSMRANHLLFWDAIRWGCENGYALLDFGRTDCVNEGLRLFKGRWGAVEMPLYYSTIPAQPYQEVSVSRLKSAVHSLIKRSPVWICRLSGELLYRHFG